MTPRAISWVVLTCGLLVQLGVLLWVRRRRSSVLTAAIWLTPSTAMLGLAALPHTLPSWRPPVELDASWSLLAPVCVGALVLASRARDLDHKLVGARRLLHAVCVGGLLAVMVGLLGNLRGLRWTDARAAIIVWDVSRSAERAGSSTSRRESELRLAETSMRPDDLLGVVEVGAQARVAVPLHPRNRPGVRLETHVGRDGTDLEAGLRRALAELGERDAASVVMVTDGVENRGDLLRATPLASARGVTLDAVVLDYAPPLDVHLAQLSVPGRVARDEPFDMRLQIEAPAEAAGSQAEIVILRDGKPWQTRALTLAAGRDLVRLPLREQEPGLHRYDAELRGLRADVDGGHENDRRTAFVHVRGESTALLVSTAAGRTALDTWLQDAGFSVRRASADTLPNQPVEWASHDLVVLDAIDASTLGPARMTALARAVTEVGTGLLLVGGPQAFGPGGYSGTPIEAISPVGFDLKKDKKRPSLAEAIVIDYSGSMSAQVGSVTKIALANEAAARSALLLSPSDSIAVAHVDTTVRWTVPMSLVGERSDLERTIRSVDAGGGGIYTDVALKAAYASLRGIDSASLRHVLLFADGGDAEQLGGCRELVRAALRSGVTTSVISLGRGSDSTELEVLSRLGEGRFYLVEDAATLPEVFTQETVLASRRAFREEPVVVSVVEGGAMLRGIDALPTLQGYVVTESKPNARVVLAGLEDEPLLADVGSGVGKVGAFTSDLRGRWSQAWLASGQGPRLIAQTARSLSRAALPGGHRVETSLDRGRLRVDVHAEDADAMEDLQASVVDPHGVVNKIPLEPVARGSYEAELDLQESGVHVVSVSGSAPADGDRHASPQRLLGQSAVAFGASDELVVRPSNRALLERVTEAGGGQLRTTLEGLFDAERSWHAERASLYDRLVWTAAALLLAMVASRRLAWPQRKPQPAAAPRVAALAPEELQAVRRRRVRLITHDEVPRHAPEPAQHVPAATATVPAEPPPAEAASDAPPSPQESTIERLAARRRARR